MLVAPHRRHHHEFPGDDCHVLQAQARSAIKRKPTTPRRVPISLARTRASGMPGRTCRITETSRLSAIQYHAHAIRIPRVVLHILGTLPGLTPETARRKTVRLRPHPKRQPCSPVPNGTAPTTRNQLDIPNGDDCHITPPDCSSRTDPGSAEEPTARRFALRPDMPKRRLYDRRRPRTTPPIAATGETHISVRQRGGRLPAHSRSGLLRVSAKSLLERCDQRFCGVTRRAG